MRNPAREWTLRDPKQRDLENRFVAVTHDRLRRVFDTLSTRQQDLVEVMPVLFHLNHPLLPGYVSQDTPCGIADYSPDRTALAAARRLVKTFTYERRGPRQFGIKGLYLMGSAGTIAYSRDSDLDIWVCHDPALGDAEIEKVVRKAQIIEAFSQNHGLEVHFYVFDAERFKRGESIGLSAESSGSSQRYLLLDEFYRSGLLLAGLKPLWWYVPSSHEGRYDEYVELAFRQRRISPRHYVDFGGLPAIPAAEFFGAALWQLYKSIESPYKSVMKLLLMECYAAEHPTIRLLSHRYKEALSAARVTLDELDPYLAMYRKVEEYLLTRDDTSRLRLLRRAFYIKTNEQLSLPSDPRQSPWRREVLEDLARDWGWSQPDFLSLDNRNAWRIDTAIDERRELIRTLQRSYSVLSEFARRNGHDQHITEHDLNILGRKLYAAFEKKPHKLELITRGICQTPVEAELSLHQTSDPDQASAWLVYVGKVESLADTAPTPLKRGALVEVLTWCYFNRLAGPQTTWHLFVNGQRQALAELRRILEALAESWPTRLLWSPTIDDLANRPIAIQVSFFVNVGCEVNPGGLAQGDVLTSSHTDAFQFGGGRSNLVVAIDTVISTSWGELYSYRHTGAAVSRAVADYLERSPEGLPRLWSVYCFTPDYGQIVSHRVGQFLNDLCKRFATLPRAEILHYIVAVDESFHEIFFRDQKTQSRVHSSALSLFNALREPSASFRQVEFDRNCADLTALTAVYRHNKRGLIQVFGYARATKLDVYVLDEFGDLYVERQLSQNIATLFDHVNRFFSGMSQPRDDDANLPLTAEYYQLVLNPGDSWRALPFFIRNIRAEPYIGLRMVADLDSEGRAAFTCHCDDQAFDTREHGARLFAAIAQHVLTGRHSGERYPIYLTQLTLSERYAAARGQIATRTAGLLEFKKRLEYQLTKALRHEVPR